jgi:hypothetical protein
MSSSIAKAGLAALAILAVARPASAETVNYDYYCVGAGALQACASVRLTSNGNNLTMQVWNLNGTMGGQHTMTAIGLYHNNYDWTGKVMAYSVDYYNHDGSTTPIDIKQYWTAKQSTDIKTLAGVKVELAEGNSGNSGIVGCVNPGGGTKWATCWNGGSSYPGAPYVQFNFTLNSHFALDDQLELRWHSQQLANGNSVKCDTGGAGDYPPCDYNPPVTTTPEPASLALMLSGLAAVAGVGAVRRRRRENTEI